MRSMSLLKLEIFRAGGRVWIVKKKKERKGEERKERKKGENATIKLRIS